MYCTRVHIMSLWCCACGGPGGTTVWQLECRLRALALLIAVIDGSASSAAAGTTALVNTLLESAAVHGTFAEILGWVLGPLQAALRQGRQAPPTAALDAADAPTAQLMVLVLAACLGLICRLLQMVHTTHSPLHDSLLAQTQESGARCLGACVLLHAELAEDPSLAAASTTRSNDVALVEFNMSLNDDAMGEMETFLPLCPVGIADIGPLAARCLAMLCHAAPTLQPAGGLLPHVSHMSPSLSCTVGAWLAAAAEHVRRAAEEKVPTTDPFVIDCASAGLQLLGAAAEVQPLLLAALCRGGPRPGESVRVLSGCCEPDGGWGLVSAGHVGTVRTLDDGAAFVDFQNHASWVAGRPASQLELCPAQRQADDETELRKWEHWDELKPQLEQEASTRTHALKHAALASAGGPLEPMQRLLATGLARGDSGAEPHAMLRVQILSVMVEIWRHPAGHHGTLATFREDKALWASLGEMILLPDVSTKRTAEKLGLALLQHALCIQLFTCEVALAAPPSTLSSPAADLLRKTMKWLAEGSDTQPGAAALSSALLNAPNASAPRALEAEIQRLASSFHGHASSGDVVGIIRLQGLPISCARMPYAVESADEPGEAASRGFCALWAGGRSRLLESVPLLDFEMMRVRAWRLRENELRSGAAGHVVEAQDATLEPAAHAIVAAVAAAVDDATERALAGDERAPQEAAVLLDHLPAQLRQLAQPATSEVGHGLLKAAPYQMLARAAAKFNAASMAAGAHGLLVRNWNLFLALLAYRGDLARPAATVGSPANISTPSWLSGVSEQNPLETLIHARICDLAGEQAAWAEQCASARVLLGHVETLDAAAELLIQQGNALRGGPALAWQLVEKLITRPSWQHRLQQLRESLDRASVGSPGREMSKGVPASHLQQTATREIRMLAMAAILDDGSHSRRGEAGEGWQLLRKLTSHVRLQLEAVGTKAGYSALSTPLARSTLSQAVAELKRRDEQLRELVVGGTVWSEEPATSSLPEQLLLLATQVESGSGTSLQMFEQEALSTRDYLDTDQSTIAGNSAVGRTVKAHKEGGGAAQLLQQAAAAPSSDGAGAKRQELMGEALSRLACARESLLHQAYALRQHGTLPSSSKLSSMRQKLLHSLRSCDATSARAWELAGNVHESLAEELLQLDSDAADVGQGAGSAAHKVVDALIAERLDAATHALADRQQSRSDTTHTSSDSLRARALCSSKLIDLLRMLQAGGETDLGVTALASAITTLLKDDSRTAALGGSGASAQTVGAAVNAAVDALLGCESKSVQGDDNHVSDDQALVLESRAAHVHEVMRVLSIALHHERTAHVSMPSAPRTASTLLVRTLGGRNAGEGKPSFLLSFVGASPSTLTRQLDPHGWYSKEDGAVTERAPQALCRLLWPAASHVRSNSNVPYSDALHSHNEWQCGLPSALRALLVNLSEQLVSCARGNGPESTLAEAAAIVLCALRKLLQPRPRSARIRQPPPGLLSNDDLIKILPLLTETLVAAPGKHGAQASLVRALILVLSHAEIDGSDVQRVQMGALVLTLLPRVTTDTDALVALSLLLQYATPEWKSTAATELMKAVLHQPISQSTLTLPSLLRVAGTPALACEILDAGLVRPAPAPPPLHS